MAYIVSIIQYSSHSFISLPYYYHNKLQKLIMTCCRWVLGNACFRQSTKSILNRSNLLSASQLMVISSHRFFYRVVNYHIPEIIFKKLTFPKRTCQRMTISNKGKFSLQDYVHVGLRVFSQMPIVVLKSKRDYNDEVKAAVSAHDHAALIIRKSRAY